MDKIGVRENLSIMMVPSMKVNFIKDKRTVMESLQMLMEQYLMKANGAVTNHIHIERIRVSENLKSQWILLDG